MAGKRKPPTPGSAEGSERIAYDLGDLTLPRLRAQLIAARFALPLETAATVAALALGGGANA